MKKIIFLGLLMVSNFLFASVSIKIEPSKINLGQSFNLYLKMDGNEANAIPNLIPLQKDFRILGSERSSTYSIVNGQVNSSTQWSILLTAKEKGIFAIPPLEIGNLKTESVTIEVGSAVEEPNKSSTNTNTSHNDTVLLETTASSLTPYLNQQIIYTVKLYNSARLLEATYEPPQVDEALVIPFPDGKRYQTVKNGRIYMVEEQQFAIFPQKSGDLKIKPPAFHALVYETTPQQLSVEGDLKTLKVLPIPAEYQAKSWLPAKELNLSEHYDKSETSVIEGSTLSRTIIVSAKGLPAQLLPNLDLQNSDRYSVYPEKASEQNELKDGNLIGTKTFKITYLLNKSGDMTIPVFNLAWFNTTTGKSEIMSLPALKLSVIAKNPGQENKALPEEKKQKSVENTPNNAQQKSNMLPWWIAAILGLGWIATLVGWKWTGQKKDLKPRLSDIKKKLKIACLNNNINETKDLLLQWGNFKWPTSSILNLTQLLVFIESSSLKERIEELSTLSYQQDKSHSWQGKPLWDAFCNYKEQKVKPEDKSTLPPISKL